MTVSRRKLFGMFAGAAIAPTVLMGSTSTAAIMAFQPSWDVQRIIDRLSDLPDPEKWSAAEIEAHRASGRGWQ